MTRTSRTRVLAYFFLAGSGLGFLLLAFLPAAIHTDRVAEAAAEHADELERVRAEREEAISRAGAERS